MERQRVESYRDLIVWQKGVDLVTDIYKLTKVFPQEETYGLMSQMRRAAISIPSNIAEGKYRKTKKDFMQFLRITFASGAELETQIEISKRLSYASSDEIKKTEDLLGEVMRILNALLKKLSTSD